jgi:uncharacterized phage protein gp47/JayE
MSLPVKSFSEIVNDQVAIMQAAAGQPLDFSIGSVLLALVESNAGNSLWLQALVTQLLAVTRLTTSSGNDVDTFVGQFGLTRNPPVPASGNVTFSRFTTTAQAIIQAATIVNGVPVGGALVAAVVNGVNYMVMPDPSNPDYNASLNAYVIQISSSSVTVPVQATTAGSVGNVFADQITIIVSVIPNVDSVTNSQPFTNGLDQESDEALKARFVLYLNSLSKATKEALEAAIQSVPGVERYKLVENVNEEDVTQLGYFYVVVDDGSGDPPGTLLTQVAAAVEAVRGFTIAYSIDPPTPFPMSFSVTVVNDGSIPDSDLQTAVENALETYITTSSFDALFPYSKIPEIVYNASPAVENLNSGYTQNGVMTDILLTTTNIATIGTISVTVV